MRILHLMTQDNQPYGSRRKCCEICGIQIEGRQTELEGEHYVTDDRKFYDGLKNIPRIYRFCNEK